MGFLSKLFGKKDGEKKPTVSTVRQPTSSPVKTQGGTNEPAKPTPSSSKSQQMQEAEKDAMAIENFDDAAKTLTDLYKKWTTTMVKDVDLVGGLNYIEGKKDACFVINLYLSGDKEYDAKRIYSLVKYDEGFPQDIVHQGSLDVLRWAASRIVSSPVIASERKEYLKNIISIAMKADWYSPNNVDKLLNAIKNTWGVDCKIVRLTEQQIQEVEQQYPLETKFEDISQEYQIRLSSNSIFIHEHGAWTNFGYLKFLYHDRIYYVNVAPLVNMTASVFSRMDDLSHMAKIMITLGERGRSDRTPFMIYLEGDLVQNE